jgi:hypothetical protein
MYGMHLRESVVDEAVDVLLRDGLQIQERYDRRQISLALAPVVVCLHEGDNFYW